MMTLKMYCYRLLREPSSILSKTYGVWCLEGFRGLRQKILNNRRQRIEYNDWIKRNDTIHDEDRIAIKEHIDKIEYKPLISIVMPVYNTPERYLRLAIESVQKQLYTKWELCIADDASSLPHIRRLLEQYQNGDPRIKVVFREKNGHISVASNSALGLVSGEFVALMDHDDEISEHALYMVIVELNTHPETDLIYSDEDKIDKNGRRFDYYFKPDWNRDFFYSQNYFSHLGVYRTTIIQKVGGFREGFEGSQDYDLCLRCVTQTEDHRIRHIPYVLYHWRAIKGSAALHLKEKPYAENSTFKALRDNFDKIDPNIKLVKGTIPNTFRRIYPIPKNPPLVNLIIPTMNRYDLLEKCISSIRNKTTYSNYEILVVYNQSTNLKTSVYLEELKRKGWAHIVPYHHSFNYSAIFNFAVNQASSELIALLNNDVEVISPGWLNEMVSHAIRPEIGAVGSKLYYPDGRIQHGGVILGCNKIADHAHRYYPGNSDGYVGRLKLPQNLSAVTGACLVMRRAVYIEAGGMEEKNLPIMYNDIDLCLRIREKGYSILWTPDAELYHHEFSSRGIDNANEKMRRTDSEIAYMHKRWGKILNNDPFYNPNFSVDQANFYLSTAPRVSKPWKITRDYL